MLLEVENVSLFGWYTTAYGECSDFCKVFDREKSHNKSVKPNNRASIWEDYASHVIERAVWLMPDWFVFLCVLRYTNARMCAQPYALQTQFRLALPMCACMSVHTHVRARARERRWTFNSLFLSISTAPHQSGVKVQVILVNKSLICTSKLRDFKPVEVVRSTTLEKAALWYQQTDAQVHKPYRIKKLGRPQLIRISGRL